MTHLGARLRRLRSDRGVTLGEMAAALVVSAAYLSALEHGKRGVPRAVFLELINGYFNLGWDDAEELRRLADVSDPRVVLDTAGLSPKATEFANLLAARIGDLDDSRFDTLLAEIEDP